MSKKNRKTLASGTVDVDSDGLPTWEVLLGAIMGAQGAAVVGKTVNTFGEMGDRIVAALESGAKELKRLADAAEKAVEEK